MGHEPINISSPQEVSPLKVVLTLRGGAGTTTAAIGDVAVEGAMNFFRDLPRA